MQGHNFNRTLHAKGMFVYCGRCGLIRLGNRATEKQINKACVGARELEDEEYLRLKGQLKGNNAKIKIKLLAQEAGFCFFTPEEDAEEPIDWSCDYEQEFKVFADLLQKQTRKETIQEIVTLLKELHEISKDRHNLYLYIANLIEEDFKE